LYGTQQQEILIFVTFPNMSARKVKISSSESINVLFKILPSGKKIAFYHGEIINSADSFQHYGISDYDRIAIIHENQLSFKTEQFWKKTTQRDYENKRIIKAFENHQSNKSFHSNKI
jgi:hypothetical protein